MQVLLEVLSTINKRLSGVPLNPIRVLVGGQNGVEALPPGIVSRIMGPHSPQWREAEHTVIISPSLLSGDPEDLEASIWHAIIGLADRQAEDAHFYESINDLGLALPEVSGEEDSDEPLMTRVREQFARAMTGAEIPLTPGDHNWPLTGWSSEVITRIKTALSHDDE